MTGLSYECHMLGDSAIVIQLGTDIHISILKRVRRLTAYLEQNQFEGLIEMVPAYATITIYYDSFQVYSHYAEAVTSGQRGFFKGMNTLLPSEIVLQHIRQILDGFYSKNSCLGDEPEEVFEIPVCYGEGYGPDLAEVAAYHRLSEEEIVELHTAQVYPVHMIGFAPGFPYLGGMDNRLATPRKSVPRTKIPAGSVGIGGAQTGIYPFETPGGWHVIGRTPVALFRPEFDPPSLLKVGDQVKFVSITPEQFADEWERNIRDGL